VTFRLADSLPQTVLAKWRIELEKGKLTDTDFRRRIEFYLDQNYGSSVLKNKKIASVVQETLLKFDGEKYKLIGWVIMPNHVHLLIKVLAENSLSVIMHSIKSFTAHEANKILNKKGRFWSKEYFDRFIRDEKHFFQTVRYIEMNPVKAKLCQEPSDWKFSSGFYKKKP
ncbi:MAG TPA: transposase, partial [Pyrinomonadaceae bacterium]|nr:transposase [Pyrinomonadaceae bacterium]